MNCQVEKKPDVKKPTHVDEVEFNVLDIESTRYLMVTEPCWCRSVGIMNIKIIRKSVSSNKDLVEEKMV